MTSQLSIEEFSECVEIVYEAALDPEKWYAFGRRLCEATDSVLGGIGVFDAATMEFVANYAHGLPERYWELNRATVPHNPMMPYIALSKPGEAWTNARIAPEPQIFASRFYKDFMRPLGLRDAVGVVTLRHGARFGVIVANRAEDKPLYGDAERNLLARLSPHVARSLTIADALDLRRVEANALETAFDGLATGVFLIDDDANVLHANHAAERILTAGRVLTMRGGQLWPLAATSKAALTAALAGTIVGQGLNYNPEPSILLVPPTGTGPGMIATLLPLRGRTPNHKPRAGSGRWALFVQDPRAPVPMPGEAFARLYKLSPAEYRVAMSLITGQTSEEVADSQGVTVATIRSHIKRLLTKTNTNRQIDFVRLMMMTMPPVGAPPN